MEEYVDRIWDVTPYNWATANFGMIEVDSMSVSNCRYDVLIEGRSIDFDGNIGASDQDVSAHLLTGNKYLYASNCGENYNLKANTDPYR